MSGVFLSLSSLLDTGDSPDLVLVHSDAYANWAFSAHHPTQGRRFMHARERLLASAPSTGVTVAEVASDRLASLDELALVHSHGYIAQVLEAGQCDEWSGSRPDLALLAQRMAGGTLVALDALLMGVTGTAVNFAGAKHHAQRDSSRGFCVFADLAMAAHVAVARGARVAMLDIDAHHGDGTEHLTRECAEILTFSVHEGGIFPGTGLADAAEQHVYNEPLAHGAGDDELFFAVSRFVDLAEEYQPDLIMIAIGADGMEGDPLTTLRYSVAGMADAVRVVREAFPSKPMLLGGAGGYRPDDLTPEAWVAMALAAAAC